MSDNENKEAALRRSTRNRVQRDSNPCDYLDGEEEEEDNRRPPVDLVRSEKPNAGTWWHWKNKINVDEYSTVDDSDKLTQYNSWNGRRYLVPADVMRRAQKDLVADQGQNTVSLERVDLGWLQNKFTQVPYRE